MSDFWFWLQVDTGFELKLPLYGYSDTFINYRQPSSCNFLGTTHLVCQGMVHVCSIKFTVYLVIGKPPSVRSTSCDIILGILHAPIINIVQSFNITLVGNFHGLVVNCGFQLIVGNDLLSPNWINVQSTKESYHPLGLSQFIIFLQPCCCIFQLCFGLGIPPQTLLQCTTCLWCD